MPWPGTRSGFAWPRSNSYAEAKRLFLDASKRRDDKVLAAKICYNLGAVAQNLGETRGALPILAQMRGIRARGMAMSG